jgi:hypothetical protein
MTLKKNIHNYEKATKTFFPFPIICLHEVMLSSHTLAKTIFHNELNAEADMTILLSSMEQTIKLKVNNVK